MTLWRTMLAQWLGPPPGPGARKAAPVTAALARRAGRAPDPAGASAAAPEPRAPSALAA